MRALAASLALFLAVCAQAQQPPTPDRDVAQIRPERREAQRLAELEAQLRPELRAAARAQAERLRRLQQQPSSTDKRDRTLIAPPGFGPTPDDVAGLLQ
jgi:hypothetical protein